jgi:6-phosphofructokinase
MLLLWLHELTLHCSVVLFSHLQRQMLRSNMSVSTAWKYALTASSLQQQQQQPGAAAAQAAAEPAEISSSQNQQQYKASKHVHNQHNSTVEWWCWPL